MLKRILIIAALSFGVGCFANSAVRIDLNGTKDGVVLESGKMSDDLKSNHPDWLKDKKQCYLTIFSSKKLTDKWHKFDFSFTPDKDGIVKIHFMGAYHKPEGAKKNIAVWTAYDNITITGTEAKNCDFEFVNQKNIFDGWTGNADNMVTGSKDAKSGKNYIIVWHNNPVYQTLKVKKGQEVTITLFAKASEGPVKKKNDIQNI